MVREGVLPEVVRAVFVGDNDDGDLGVILDRVGAVGRVRKVLLDVGRQALEDRFSRRRSGVSFSFNSI